jgi:hypothetical protein
MHIDRRLRRAASCATAVALLLAPVPAWAQQRAVSDGGTIPLKVSYVGYKFVESSEEDCPDMRPNGAEVLTAKVRLVDAEAGVSYEYEGTGRFSVDIDGCGLTPNRGDPGMVHDRGDVPGDFHGDNFLGCKVTTVLPEHAVRVRVEVDMVDAQRPNYVKVEWEPVGPAPGTKVSTGCEPAYHAEYVKQMAGTYRGRQSRQIVDYDLLPRLAPGGELRTGVYRSVDDEGLTLTVGQEAEEEKITVAIDGPACPCLEGEKVPGKTVTYTARASPGGGSFGPFTISAGGTAPKVIRNSGGTLVLEPGRATGAVTLAVEYTRRGKRSRASKAVSLCVIDSIRIADGERDFAFDDASPGLLAVPAVRSRALYNGADASAELGWSFERIGPPGETTVTPADPRGGTVTVEYRGLPSLNGAFGKKGVEVRLKKGDCDCARRTDFRAFYSPTATNHPAAGADALGEQPVPNWFYYHAQTSALRGIARVAFARQRTSSDGKPAIGQFDEASGLVYLTARLWSVGCQPAVPRSGKPVPLKSGGGNSGIDCVAETVRHEDRHRRDDAEWWPGGYSLARDPDLDRVPAAVEAKRPGCRDEVTVPPGRTAKTCDERPFLEVSDREINAYWTGWAWPKGAADAEDWACGPLGKQWKAGINCAE